MYEMAAKKKITKRKQFDVLLGEMEKYKHVAKGQKYSENFMAKERYAEIWKEITVRLNSLGPPTRKDTEWQKVWNDFKLNLKKKLQENRREFNSTGGGPNKLHHFSVYEEKAIHLLDLEKVCNPSGRVFGLPEAEAPARQLIENCPESFSQAGTSSEVSVATRNNILTEQSKTFEQEDSFPERDDPAAIEQRDTPEDPPAPSTMKTSNVMPTGSGKRYRKALLDKQTFLLEKISNSMKDIEKYYRRTYYSKEKKIKFEKAYKERKEKRQINKENVEIQILNLQKRKLEVELERIDLLE